MAKRFRLRISRIIPSFHSCGSKDSSFSQFPPATPTVLPKHRSPLPSKPHRAFLKPRVSSAFRCCNRSKPTLSDDDHSESPPEFRWEKEDKYWHVITTPKTNGVVQTQTPRRKIYNSSAEDDDVLPPPPPPPSAEKKKKRRSKMKKQKRTTLRTIRVSTSSAESGLFSSDGFDDDVDDEEIETLVSTSRSFSTDSLETIRELAAPNHHPTTTTRRNKKKKKKKKVAKRRVSESEWWSATETSPETAAPARLSVFQRLIPCSVEGKVRESFAVVKRSEDPYEDFKRSMMEMILEKQMFDDKDLEQLLHCFLSLNSKHHHGAIVRAFIEIWEVLFCASSTRSSSASGRRVSRAL